MQERTRGLSYWVMFSFWHLMPANRPRRSVESCADGHFVVLHAYFIGLHVVLRNILLPAKAILDSEAPIVDSAVDDVAFDATQGK